MPRQTPEQFAAFQELCRANNLDPKADVWQQKQSGQWIIGRTGIEKIQALNHIAVSFEVAGFGPDYAGVKASATRSVKEEGTRTAKKLVIESFGSAHPKNCLQITYYLEMAEKRAKSRAVLMLMGFYALGIYGEDEAEAFQRPAEASEPTAPAQPAGNVSGASPTPSAPPVMRAESNSAAPVASTGSGQSIAGPAEIPAEIIAKFTRQFEAATSGIDVKTLWEKLTGHEKKALFDVKEAAKVRLADKVASTVAQVAPAPLKQTSSTTGAIDELLPAEGEAPERMQPTEEMLREAHRLLNNPKIYRNEKTKFLLNINRMGYNRVRESLGKLRALIAQREGYHEPSEAEQVSEVRATIAALLKQHEGKLEIEDEGKLRAALGDAKRSLEDLQLALRAGQEAAWDAESDGTERELDQTPAAA